MECVNWNMCMDSKRWRGGEKKYTITIQKVVQAGKMRPLCATTKIITIIKIDNNNTSYNNNKSNIHIRLISL